MDEMFTDDEDVWAADPVLMTSLKPSQNIDDSNQYVNSSMNSDTGDKVPCDWSMSSDTGVSRDKPPCDWSISSDKGDSLDKGPCDWSKEDYEMDSSHFFSDDDRPAAPDESYKSYILLTAPTGKAGKVLGRRTGFPGYTIHQVCETL